MGRNTLFSFIWKMLERISTQLVQFVVQIVLARLLMPEDYGIVAIVMILISFASVFVQAGFNSALIQRKDATNEDFSSVLYINLLMAFVLYIIIYLSSEVIADFYKQPLLTNVLRVSSLTLFFSAVNSVQYAYISKRLEFKKSFYSYFVAVTLSGFAGIILAINGFGVWALVVYQLLNNILICIIMWLTVKWRPVRTFSISRIKILFTYGWKIFFAHMIDAIYKEVQYIFLGKIATPEVLGYYSRGMQFPGMFVRNINDTIKTVLLPMYSKEQEDNLKVKTMLRISIGSISYIVFPIMVGMAVVAEPMIKLLLTDKWLPAVPFVQIFSASYALSSLMSSNGQAINSVGRSDIYLKIILGKILFIILSLPIALKLGVYAVALSTLFADLLGIFLTFKPNRALFNYTIKEILLDIIPSLGIALLMGAIVYLISFAIDSALYQLITQVVVGILSYIIMSRIFKLKEYSQLIEMIKTIKQSS
ncbi:MAG TPA: flippase [Proteiniclasticum sp.]|uniref:lipopolysaccharide biosynthesis protein n=1 Tax=Proteiniclasticum sp. TaxID=2053595 RepID=UPI000E9D63C6|nr:lipopolysaccharide biosynthesis protein [Proteiniclasticum sp.]HBW13307.1 flippase [Proteiniclasticum sp.]